MYSKSKFIIAAQHNNENEPVTNEDNVTEGHANSNYEKEDGDIEDIDNNGDDRYR